MVEAPAKNQFSVIASALLVLWPKFEGKNKYMYEAIISLDCFVTSFLAMTDGG